ncbi:phage major capsid protein [Gordonia terrae]|uniref:phage major capsid protein n=1 Tax=Gordonia terrae TaxID=2055 RepID=UPI003F6BCBF3
MEKLDAVPPYARQFVFLSGLSDGLGLPRIDLTLWWAASFSFPTPTTERGKTMTLKTTNTDQAWHPDVQAFAPTDIVPDALIVQASTKAADVEGDQVAVRVAYVSDDEAQVTAEGAEIPEADPELSETLAYTSKITQLMRVSREQDVQNGTSDQLAKSARRALTKKANALFISQVAPTAPTVAPVAGLVNVDGVVTGDPVTGDLDSLIDLVAALQANGATPSHLILDPIGWAALRKLKTATGSNQSLRGAGTNDAAQLLLSIPTLVSAAVPSSSGLIVDSAEVISAYGEIQVATSTDAYFSSDSIAVRATWRVGHTVPRANRIGKFTIGE